MKYYDPNGPFRYEPPERDPHPPKPGEETPDWKCQRCGDEAFGKRRGQILCGPCMVEIHESEADLG